MPVLSSLGGALHRRQWRARPAQARPVSAAGGPAAAPLVAWGSCPSTSLVPPGHKHLLREQPRIHLARHVVQFPSPLDAERASIASGARPDPASEEHVHRPAAHAAPAVCGCDGIQSSRQALVVARARALAAAPQQHRARPRLQHRLLRQAELRVALGAHHATLALCAGRDAQVADQHWWAGARGAPARGIRCTLPRRPMLPAAAACRAAAPSGRWRAHCGRRASCSLCHAASCRNGTPQHHSLAMRAEAVPAGDGPCITATTP
jgi:hypothetical protein